MKPEEMKAEFRNLVAELKEAVTNENQEAVDKINERMDAIELEVKNVPKPQMSREEKASEVKDQFKSSFYSFAKGDRQSLQNVEIKSGYHPSLRKSDNLVRFDFASAGALLMPAEVSSDILRDVIESTPILGLARVTSTDRSEYKRRVRTGTPGGTWLAEDAAVSKGKPTYGEITITPFKYAARYAMTVEQMQDSAYDLVREITDAFRDDASVDLGTAFTKGSGIGQPTGMVGNITNYDATQLALTASDLINMQEELKEDYHSNASWLFTRKTRANIRTQFLGTDGLQYLWEPSFKAGIPSILLGAPVYIARDTDLAGRNAGNFTAGQVYAIYGDFARGYEIAQHTDMFMIDDPYSEASSFVRNYNIMARFGGNVVKSEALVQITAAGS